MCLFRRKERARSQFTTFEDSQTPSPITINSVLIREEGKSQKPIYYISKVLHNAKTRYARLEKFIFTFIVYAWKLRPYFQAHSIILLTDQSMKAVLHRPNTSGRIAK